jgi:uncharacterized repeat protein (TIGR01451 family)
MNKLWIIDSIVFSIALAVTPAAHATQAQPVQLHGEVKLEKVVVQDGIEKRILSEPKVVVPGDRLFFTTAYHNSGTASVAQFVVTNPIPAAVVLTQDSAASLEVSVDGGKGWGALASRTVPDGQGGNRAAQAGDITHVRWTLSVLQPGASGTLAYHAIVR